MDLAGAPRRGSVFCGDPLKIAAPDPVSSPELLNFVAHRYDLAVATAVDLGGSFNLNLLIDHYALRVYGPWVSSERLTDRSLDPPRMLCDLATGGCSTLEPAVLVELGDVVDRDLADRQLPDRFPELVGPEVMSPAVNEV